VVVTARKREERLRDIPIAASVLDAELLEKRGVIMETGGIVSASPGARFNDLTFTVLSEVSLRGSGTARGTNAETGVGLYANGVYVGGGLQFARNYTRLDFFDLERAEVLRGTLGALYGRNAVGGAVNLIAQQPEFERYGRMMLDYGADIDKKLVHAIGNANLNDHLAFRVSAEYIDQDEGLYHNTTLDRYVDEMHDWLVRGQMRYQNGALDVNLLGQSMDQHIGGGQATLVQPAGTGCPATATQVCYLQDYEQVRYQYPHDSLDDVVQDVEQGVLTVTYEFSGAILSSVSSYRRRFTRFFSDADLMDAATLAQLRAGGIVTGGANMRTDRYQDLEDTTKTIYQDLHLTSRGSGPLTWMIGTEYVDIDGLYTPIQVTAPPAGAGTTSTLDYQSWAGYGSLGYDVTERVNLSGEIRYTKDEKDFDTFGFNVPSNVVTAPLRVLTFSNSNVSYNAVASLKVNPQWLAYAKFGTGYRAGGFNTAVDPPPPAMPPRPVQPTFDNEESETFEIGVKGDVTRSFYTTLSAYWTTVDGPLTQVDNGCFLGNPVCSARPANYAVNGGEAEIWGVEVEGTLRVELGSSSTVLRVAGSRQNGEFKGGAYDGFTVPQTPDWLATANLDVNVPLGSVVSAFIFNLNYRGQWGGFEGVAVGTEPPVEMSDFQVIDVRAGLRFGREGNSELAVYGSNVTDDQFTLLEAATSVRWSRPRTWGIQFRQRWD
jgi:iron complex outermembrane receptor protein